MQAPTSVVAAVAKPLPTARSAASAPRRAVEVEGTTLSMLAVRTDKRTSDQRCPFVALNIVSGETGEFDNPCAKGSAGKNVIASQPTAMSASPAPNNASLCGEGRISQQVR